MTLFIDDRLRRNGFNTTEDFIRFGIKERCAIKFYGHEFYESFSEAGILIPDSTIIRLMSDGGYDQFYYVTESLRLEGASDMIAHAGLEGIHNPKDLLCFKNAPNGWELGGYIMFEERPRRMI